MLRGSLATALLHDHLLFIGETEGNLDVERRVINGMLDRGVSGFIYASMYTRRVRLSKTLRSQPLILLNCTTAAPGVATVIPDEREAGRAATRALVRFGHRDGIVLVGEQPRTIYAAGERRFGVNEILDQQGMELSASIDTLWWPEPAYHAVLEYLSAGHRPTAFICMNDRIAMGAYQAAAEFGLAIPQDLSVVSFDDSDLALWLRPRLTSVAIPHFELGRRAVEILLAARKPTGVQRIPMPLRDRESIGPPGRRKPIRRAATPLKRH
jgi:LacI family transcriptional regulator